MCRILLINQKEKEDVRQYIENFVAKCRTSKEYQGDGFGITYKDGNAFKTIKSLKPIWDASNLIQQIPYTTFALVHARSAFGEETIGDIENNQPFQEDKFLFATNLNLQGVKIKSSGKIGAHKIFNLLKNKGIKTGLKEIHENTKYIKALNFIAIQNNQIIIHNEYGQDEDPNYFNLWESENKERIVISSELLPNLEMKSLEGKGTFTYTLQ